MSGEQRLTGCVSRRPKTQERRIKTSGRNAKPKTEELNVKPHTLERKVRPKTQVLRSEPGAPSV